MALKFQGSEAEYGIIEYVSVKNFMCHKHLEFNFGPHVNLIVGRNASGKSAILTAIVVGLGGKAASTNLIKNTEHVADITIKLRNRGPDAFKPDQYGSTIIVERRIKSDGTSSYKIRSKDGKIISQKYSELQQIKELFNIQIDNPMSILNQDTSRNLLHPKDSYKYFLKATQLEQMTDVFNNIQQHKELMKDTLERKEEILLELKREVLQNEQRFKDLDSIPKLEKKRESFLHSTVDCLQVKMESIEAHCHSLQDQLTELGEKIRELQPQHATAKSEMDKQKKKERDITKKMNSQQNHLKSLVGDKNDMQHRIDELKNSAQIYYEDERKITEAEIQRLQEHMKAQEAQKATTEQDLQQLASSVNRAKESTQALKWLLDLCRDLKQELHELRETQRESQGKLQELIRTNREKLPYGTGLKKKLEDVETLARELFARQENLDDLGALYKEIKKDYENMSKEYPTLDEQMNKFADQVEPIKDDVKTATTKIESAKSHLRHYNSKMTEHLDKINGMGRRYHAKIKESIKKIKKELTLFKNFLKKLDTLVEELKSTFLILRRRIVLRAKCFFIMTLSRRGYNGKIKFQHQTGELHITVQPTQGDGVGLQDIKALSGGERSFSTVCFIMAMWESMETPFRALDEFDVFTDMVNRRINMDIMVIVAKENRMRQFIFLTSLDMSKIKADPLVRISRMPDPLREDQSVLPFEPTARHEDDDEG